MPISDYAFLLVCATGLGLIAASPFLAVLWVLWRNDDESNRKA